MQRPDETNAQFQDFLSWYCQDKPRPKLHGERAALAAAYSWTARANRLDEAQAIAASPEQILRRVAQIEAKRLLNLVLASPEEQPVLRPKEIRDLVEYVRAIPPARQRQHLPADLSIDELNVLEKLTERFGPDED